MLQVVLPKCTGSVEAIISLSKGVPTSFSKIFLTLYPSTSLSSKNICRLLRQSLTQWTGHLFALPVEECKNVNCCSHCPHFMLGVPCDTQHSNESCDLCMIGFSCLDAYELLISKLPDDKKTAYSKLLEKARGDFPYFISHRWRSKIQRNLHFKFMDGMTKTGCIVRDEAVVLVDFKMKIDQLWSKETQELFFGKKGMNLMGAAVYFVNRLKIWDVRYYYFIGAEDFSQDAELTALNLSVLLQNLPSVTIKKLHLMSDGARTFMSTKLMEKIHCLNNFNVREGGVVIVDYNFSEAGEGKSELDASFALIMRLIRNYVDEGNNVTNVDELRRCLQLKLKGDKKHKLLQLKEVRAYQNVFDDNATFSNDELVFPFEISSYKFISDCPFTTFKNWVFHKNYCILKTVGFDALKSAAVWQRKEKGWVCIEPKYFEKPPPSSVSNSIIISTNVSLSSPSTSNALSTTNSSKYSSSSSPNENINLDYSKFSKELKTSNQYYFGMAIEYPKVTRSPLPRHQKNFLLNYLAECAKPNHDKGKKIKKQSPNALHLLLKETFQNDLYHMTAKQIKPFLGLSGRRKLAKTLIADPPIQKRIT